MSPFRQWSTIIALGALSGVLLSSALPPRDLQAAEGAQCRCDDDLSGKYKCNITQTACLAGSETCAVVCN